MCPQGMIAHWRHLANTIELVLPSAHPSPQPKRQIDQFSRFCTPHGRKCLYFTIGDPFPKIAPSRGGSGPPSISWLLETHRAHNCITVDSAIFAGDRRVSLYFTMGDHFPKIAPSHGGSGPHVRHDSSDPSEPTNQTEYLSVQPFLHRSPQSLPILYNGTPFSPQNCPFPWGIWTPLVLWPHRSPQPKCHLGPFSRFSRAH